MMNILPAYPIRTLYVIPPSALDVGSRVVRPELVKVSRILFYLKYLEDNVIISLVLLCKSDAY